MKTIKSEIWLIQRKGRTARHREGKVLIQIYDPKNFNTEGLLTELNDFRQIYSFLIVIFDFTDFTESIDGEKRVVKRKLREFAKERNVQAITIDNEEELYFIIKNIVQNPYKE